MRDATEFNEFHTQEKLETIIYTILGLILLYCILDLNNKKKNSNTNIILKVTSTIKNTAKQIRNISFMIGGTIGYSLKKLFNKKQKPNNKQQQKQKPNKKQNPKTKYTANTPKTQTGGVKFLEDFSTKNLLSSEKDSYANIKEKDNTILMALFITIIIIFFAIIIPAIFPLFIVILFCYLSYIFGKQHYKTLIK
jgi:hypothetical protein